MREEACRELQEAPSRQRQVRYREGTRKPMWSQGICMNHLRNFLETRISEPHDKQASQDITVPKSFWWWNHFLPEHLIVLSIRKKAFWKWNHSTKPLCCADLDVCCSVGCSLNWLISYLFISLYIFGHSHWVLNKCAWLFEITIFCGPLTTFNKGNT